VDSHDGEAGAIDNFNCVTNPPKGDVSFTGDLCVARETFLGGDAAAMVVCVIARMEMI
jgi:hypothetical protein